MAEHSADKDIAVRVHPRRPESARRAASDRDRRLDDALADTFPASDPVAIGPGQRFDD